MIVNRLGWRLAVANRRGVGTALIACSITIFGSFAAWIPGGQTQERARIEAPDAVPAAVPSLPTVQPNRRISDYEPGRYWNHTFSSGGHNIVSYGSTLFAAWYDVRSGNSDVYLATSIDGGKTFGKNRRVNDDKTTAVQYKPSIGVDRDGVLYMAWRDGRNGNADIFFARSEDKGKTFSKNIRLNDDKGFAYQGNPAIAVDPAGTVYVVWSDNREGTDDIYFTTSRDKGKTFSRNVRINDEKPNAPQSHPTIAIGDENNLLVAWEDFRNGQSDIYLARSVDGGGTFSENLRVNDDAGRAPQISPSLAYAGDGQVLIAWSDFRNGAVELPPPSPATGEQNRWELARGGNGDIYFARSTDGGATFSTNRRINDDSTERPQAFPSLSATPSGLVAVAWEDFRDGHSQVFMAKSGNGGLTFGPNFKLNDDGDAGSGHFHPSVTVDLQGRAYVIWTDERNNRFASHGEEGNDVYFASLK